MKRALLLAVAGVLLAGCAGEPPRPVTSAGPPSAAGPSAPEEAAAGTLLVTDFGSDSVSFVDPVTGDGDSVRVGTAPYGLAVGGDGRAWVATAEGVAVVDIRDRNRLALVPYRTQTGPPATGEYRGGGMGIALSPDGSRVHVGVNVPGDRGVLETIDTASLRVTRVAPVGRRPFDVDVAQDGSQVYVTNHDSFDVTVVPADGSPPRRIEVAPYGTEGGLASWLKPHYAAVRPGDGHLLLPFEGERLVVVDPHTGESTVEPMTADTHQHGVTVAPDGTLLVVGTGPIGAATGGPSLTVRAPDGRERLIPLEGPHENVVLSADGGTAFVTGGFTRDGHWDGITVVDLAAGTTRRLAAGQRPLDIAVL